MFDGGTLTFERAGVAVQVESHTNIAGPGTTRAYVRIAYTPDDTDVVRSTRSFISIMDHAYVVTQSELTAGLLALREQAAAVGLPMDLHIRLKRGEYGILVKVFHEMREEGEPNALPWTLAAFRIADEELRGSLVYVPAYFFTREADQELLRIARTDPSVKVRTKALRALHYRLSGLGIDNPGEMTMADVEAVQARRQRNRRKNQDLFPAVRSIVMDEGEPAAVRIAGLSVLSDSDARAFEEVVEEVYQTSTDPRLPRRAVRFMGPLLGERGLSPLLQIIETDAEAGVRHEAIWQLGFTGAAEALPVLEKIGQTHEDVEARWAALDGLNTLSRAGVPGAEEAFQKLKAENR